MAKRRGRRVRRYYARARARASKMTIPIAPLAGIIATPAITEAIPLFQAGNFSGGVKVLGYITGVDAAGKWSWSLMTKNLTPMVAGVVVHKIAGMAGINRALAKAKVPLLRV